MNKSLVIKEVDRYVSKLHKKHVSEYLIYLLIDNIRVSAFLEIGEQSKKLRVNELLLEHFYFNNNINIDSSSIKEISVFKN